jgi:serine-type D-Ala-D-Ala carboxypeptidase/endopeptidase (penicillin-binding protein 4)
MLPIAQEALRELKPTVRTAMTKSPVKTILIAVASVILSSIAVSAQDSRPPMVQDIQVQRPEYSAKPTSTPLIQKTGSTTNAAMPSAATSSLRTMFPALAEVAVPGYSGILVENLDGSVVVESNANFTFNPASNVKVATAYAVLKTFGPEFRFQTSVYTDGAIDRNTGTLTGNLYVSGKDPVFGYEHAVTLAHELNKMGVRHVTGDLIVTDNFTMNFALSPSVSGQTLITTIDSNKRNPAATRTWLNHLSYAGKFGTVQSVPGVTFGGSSFAQGIPSNLTLLFTHESTPVREILKAVLCYSNNFLSERLGDTLGGPFAVARIVQLNAGVPPAEFSLATSSGLGYNRVTPNAYKMTFMDIMPVAGIDKGTLEGRFDTDFSRGSLVGKTGTLGNTDGGASALAGEVNTRNGRLLFVIFNMRGSVARFRTFQNYFVSLVQGQFGGAAPMQYDAMSLDTRMARTRISYPNGRYGSD